MQRARGRITSLQAQQRDLDTTLAELRDLERCIVDHIEDHTDADPASAKASQ